jgi:hypothetical protein
VEEVWKKVPVNGYEDFYVVSNLGRVGRVRRGQRVKPLEPYLVQGYPQVRLSNRKHSRTPKSIEVHKLVALAFLSSDPVNETRWVNHRDGDKENNRLENLEYVTPKENTHHVYRTGAHGNQKGQHNRYAISEEEERLRTELSEFVVLLLEEAPNLRRLAAAAIGIHEQQVSVERLRELEIGRLLILIHSLRGSVNIALRHRNVSRAISLGDRR